MKKLIALTTLLILPCLLFAQAGGSDSTLMAGLISIIIAFGVVLAIFLIIRELVLWYWKINAIVNNQQAQLNEQMITNQLLRQQIELLNGNQKG